VEVLVSVGQLYRLQQIDSEWDEKSERLAEIEQSLGLSDEVAEARESAAEADRQWKESRAKMRALELEVASIDAKLKANQERMYGGKVRNPKELSGLSDEAKSLKRRMAELEDEELELMLLAETRERESSQRGARMRQVEAQWQEQHAVLLAEKEGLEAHLHEIDELRSEVRSRIGRMDLATYDDLRVRLGGVAVALLKHGMCQVCGVDLPTAEAQAVERGAAHFCPVCSRLLCSGG
jgi:uncharacterized protein